MPQDKHSSAFTATRLASNTFLINEYDDIYSEHPLIYAIIFPSTSNTSEAGTIILIDTGCGGASNDPEVRVTNLREFIETVDVPDNGGRPLNGLESELEGGKRMGYIVVLTHCHYDHIRDSDSPILASSHSPEFLSDIPEHSLCAFLNISTPEYTPTLVPHGHAISNLILSNKISSHVTVLHTPGHTPDSLTIYGSTSDPPMLYVGDSLYEYEPIIFPKEGSIVDWFSSIDALIGFVRIKERRQKKRVLLNAGHVTYLQPAREILQAAKGFMEDVVSGREPVRRRWVKRGEETVEYRQSLQGRIEASTTPGASRFSLICPERLISEVLTRSE
ncbi:Metallo-hydrolase/oxidoreductase [Lentinula aff. lateritia]|uniref:Metallo-hydrolase/oxidoreductase n=1 Tax=Lentinula aff. lateritia TaxID=2804960 RepID=A0ACC1UEU5_9AGAR|nr:Metallo-hydrolase/oxidoreductase [Lentinula aff. lateritia]